MAGTFGYSRPPQPGTDPWRHGTDNPDWKPPTGPYGFNGFTRGGDIMAQAGIDPAWMHGSDNPGWKPPVGPYGFNGFTRGGDRMGQPKPWGLAALPGHPFDKGR